MRMVNEETSFRLSSTQHIEQIHSQIKHSATALGRNFVLYTLFRLWKRIILKYFTCARVLCVKHVRDSWSPMTKLLTTDANVTIDNYQKNQAQNQD